MQHAEVWTCLLEITDEDSPSTCSGCPPIAGYLGMKQLTHWRERWPPWRRIPPRSTPPPSTEWQPSRRDTAWQRRGWAALAALVVPVSGNLCPSSSNVQENRQTSVQKLSEVQMCPKIVRTETISIMLMCNIKSNVFFFCMLHILSIDMTSVFFQKTININLCLFF